MSKLEEEVLTCITIELESVISEKEDVYEKFLALISILKIYFSDNIYLPAALEDINNNFKLFFDDVDYEHKVYEKMLKYMESIDDKELTEIEIEILRSFISLLDEFDDIFTYRTLAYAKFITYYNNLISMNNLNKLTYSYPNYHSKIDDDTKEKILNLIPEV